MAILRRLLLAVAFQGVAVFTWAAGNDANEMENQIKATYLYKFANYIEWPAQTFAQADTPVTIGILGAGEIAGMLNNLREPRIANARAIEIKILKPGDPFDNMQIIFIGWQDGNKIKKLLEGLQLRAVLIVTGSAGALNFGSMINFIPVDDHIRFEVSVLEAERNGLKISARLLSVAQKIEVGRP